MRRRKPTSDDFVEFVLDQLRDVDGVAARRMFDGHGLYAGETFFGIVCRGQLYFKTDDQTRTKYIAAGMEPFRPNRKQTIKTYFQVPADVLDDREKVAQWAAEAIRCESQGK